MGGPGGAVGVLTDSTAYLPAGLAAEHGVAVVPLQVVLDGRCLAEGVDVAGADVAAALRRHRSVSTSMPSPAVLLAAYERLAAAGAREVVSVHLSAEVSGTCDAARVAAREAPLPVHVVDSRTLALGLGFVVLAAARAACTGADAAEVAAVASRRAAGTLAWFSVASLDHLRRGGRIGAAAALLGSALSVKPLLTVRDGRIEPLEKVRTSARARARLEELAAAAVTAAGTPGGAGVDVAVQHLDSPQHAESLADALAARFPAARVLRGEVGAVVGAHVGPGMLAVAVSGPDVPAGG